MGYNNSNYSSNDADTKMNSALGNALTLNYILNVECVNASSCHDYQGWINGMLSAVRVGCVYLKQEVLNDFNKELGEISNLLSQGKEIDVANKLHYLEIKFRYATSKVWLLLKDDPTKAVIDM